MSSPNSAAASISVTPWRRENASAFRFKTFPRYVRTGIEGPPHLHELTANSRAGGWRVSGGFEAARKAVFGLDAVFVSGHE
jgi:hypothetical protein